MKNPLLLCSGFCALALITLVMFPVNTPADATATPAHNPKYKIHTIEEIQQHSTDEELVKISGEIIRKIKCGTYLFRGETGDIQIYIGIDAIPERGLPYKETMVIKGIVKVEEDKPIQVKADIIRYVF